MIQVGGYDGIAMLLQPQDAELFFRLHRTLMFFVNQRLKVISGALANPEAFAALPPPARLKVCQALLENLDLIETFARENPAGFAEEELAIVRSWRFQVSGRFYILRDLAKFTVFLAEAGPAIAYGVVALTQPFSDFFGPVLPVMVETVLLPFKGRIIYDAHLNRFNLSFGPGIRRSLNERFKEAKSQHGIVTELPLSGLPRPPKTLTAKAPPPSKHQKEEALQNIVTLIDQFCQAHLNEDYAVLCRKMAGKLARKRPTPLLKGSPNAWASGIVRAVGAVNFLHDKSQVPYMRSADIDHYLGTSPSSGAVKLAEIRRIFRLHPLDPEWSLPGILEKNPLVWMLQVNGLLIDVRDAPREVQEIGFHKGLIPYIPADRPGET